MRKKAEIPRTEVGVTQTEAESMQTEVETMLKVEHLNVYYRESGAPPFASSRRKQVLYDVSLSVKEGEVLGIAGESGSGKSSLAKAIVGLNRGVEGSISCSDPYPQMVFQDPYSSLNPAKKIRWLMEEVLRTDPRKKWKKEEVQSRVSEVLALVELPQEILCRFPQALSGGQRQRVAIGMALLRSPRLLIADEALSALDVTIQAQLLKVFTRLQKELHLTMLFISHDLRVLYQICDHILILKEGRVVEKGQTKTLYRTPKEGYTLQLLEAAGIRRVDRNGKP